MKSSLDFEDLNELWLLMNLRRIKGIKKREWNGEKKSGRTIERLS